MENLKEKFEKLKKEFVKEVCDKVDPENTLKVTDKKISSLIEELEKEFVKDDFDFQTNLAARGSIFIAAYHTIFRHASDMPNFAYINILQSAKNFIENELNDIKNMRNEIEDYATKVINSTHKELKKLNLDKEELAKRIKEESIKKIKEKFPDADVELGIKKIEVSIKVDD